MKENEIITFTTFSSSLFLQYCNFPLNVLFLSSLGTIVALCGHTTESGKFHVDEYCFSGLPYQTSPNLDQCLTKGEDR